MKEEEAPVFYIETPENIFWSTRKLDVTFKHVQFLFRDRAKLKVLKKSAMDRLLKNTQKKVTNMEGDV